MSATATAVRPSPVRALIGILLIALGVGLICWAAFQILRGPGTCGGDAPACPDGFLFAVLGGFASFFVVLPVGIALSPKVSGLFAAVTALVSGGLAATVYVSRFVADPIAEGTVGTWIAVGVLGAVAVLALLAAIRVGPGSGQVQERLRAADGSLTPAEVEQDTERWLREQGLADEDRGSRQDAGATASARANARVADGTEVDLGMDTIRQLLVHGLANGELATNVEVGRISPDHKPDVQRLLDLHARGVIDDDALRDALAALRTS